MSKENKPTPEFEALVEKNEWHDRSEIDKFIEVIKRLSEEPKWTPEGNYAPDSNHWSWVFNTRCKYVNLRFDMRDGGFVLTAGYPGERISLEQLQWQYSSLEDSK